MFITTMWLRGFPILTCMCVLVMIWIGAEGVRGTDQYWYVADVERIVDDLPLVTNTYFPGEMLRRNAVPDPNYIHHNSPMLYIVAFIGSILSVYNAWIFANIACHLIVASVIYSLSIKFTDQVIATLVASFYLLSPIAIWQAINPLLEMYYSALVALVLWCFFNRQNVWCTVCLVLLLALGLVSHPIFFVPAIVYGMVLVYENRRLKCLYLLGIGGAYLSSMLFLLHFKGQWLPSSFQPSISAIVASAVPGKSNMFWHYAEELPKINFELMMSKTISAIKKHIIEPRFVPFYIFTNVGILAGVYLTVTHLRRLWFVLVPLGLFGIQYVAMILLQQNHPRFQQIVAVVTFLMIALAIKHVSYTRLRGKFRIPLIGIVFLCLLAVNSFLVHTAKNESVIEDQDIRSINHIIQQVSKDEEMRIVTIDVMPHNPFSYATRPNSTLFIRSDMLEISQIEKAINLFEPNLVIVRNSESVIDLSAYKIVGRIESQRFGELELYFVGRS